MTKGYNDFAHYANDVKVELMKHFEITEAEAAEYAATFEDYFEEGVDPASAVQTEIMYISEDGVPADEGWDDSDGETIH